jgi:formate-dependent nitrite reductase membrane component NrfD
MSKGQAAATPAARDGSPVVPRAEPRSYYGRPVLAPPVWKPEIPSYFFVGGLAGASGALAAVASFAGNGPLARRASAAALGGAIISPALLIRDLGRPERFLNMLRMFKVTSPMSVGTWVLSAFGGAAALGAAREWLGVLPRTGRAAQVAGLALGPAVSTYTAALVATTAIPVWHDARRELPGVFAASSAATAGGLAAALTPVAHAGAARALAVGGGAAELALTLRMERRLGDAGAPYHAGRSGRLAKAAKAATAAGALAMAAVGRRRAGAVAAGAALLSGGALLRFSVFEAGTASAQDPAATVAPQRDRLDRRTSAPV